MNKTISYQRVNIKEGIDLHLLRTSKFKTTMIKIFLQERLRKETAPMVALISYLVFRGTNTRPTTLEMMRYLEELYGADLATDVEKRGENQFLSISLEIINQHYLPGGNDLFNEGLGFIMDVLTNPRSDGQKFDQEYFEQEKAILRDDILSLINDKSKYANERCYQLMCPNEPFSIYKYGSIEELDKIENEQLYTYYRGLLESGAIHIFVVGDVEENQVVSEVTRAFQGMKPRQSFVEEGNWKPAREVPQVIIEEDRIRQGKLAMGYRSDILRRSPEYPASLIFNGIYGVLPNSKLFMKVREEAGLAYYISTRMDSAKGILLVSSGIDSADMDKAVQLINEQLEAIRQGQVSEHELDSSKKAYRRYFLYFADDSEALIDSCMVEVSNGLDPVLEELILEMAETTVEDLQNIAKRIHLDTIYFLKGEEGAFDDDEEDVVYDA